MSIHLINMTTPFTILDSNSVLQFGKYKGRSVQDLIEFDSPYLGWLRTKPWAQSCEPLMSLIRDIEIGDLRWGKHKGKTLRWIKQSDPGYIAWLRKSEFVQTKCPDLVEKLNQF